MDYRHNEPHCKPSNSGAFRVWPQSDPSATASLQLGTQATKLTRTSHQRIFGHRGPYSNSRESCLIYCDGVSDTVQLWHDLFMKEVQRGNDLAMREVADVKHTHEVIGADLAHLLI